MKYRLLYLSAISGSEMNAVGAIELFYNRGVKRPEKSITHFYLPH